MPNSYLSVLLGPLSKLLLLFCLLFATFFPCTALGVSSQYYIALHVLLLVILGTLYFYVARKDREPRFLVILFLFLTFIGSLLLYMLSFHDCTYRADTVTVISNVSLAQIKNYEEGSFRCIDGEVVLNLTTVVHIYLPKETQSWIVAPIVGSRATWNATMEVPAWAYAHGTLSASPPSAWANTSVHEGILTQTANEDAHLRSAVHTAAHAHKLITSAAAPILDWGPLEESVLSSDLWMLASNVLIYGLFIILCVVSFYFHWRKLHLRNAIERDYLLENADKIPNYTYSKVSFYT